MNADIMISGDPVAVNRLMSWLMCPEPKKVFLAIREVHETPGETLISAHKTIHLEATL